jgi:cytochrome c biogenesis protein CcdA
MGFLETLTLVFIVLKLTAVIEWTWWQVFSPMLAGYAVIFFGAMMIAIVNGIREHRRD